MFDGSAAFGSVLDFLVGRPETWLPYGLIIAGVVGALHFLLPKRKSRPCKWQRLGNRAGTRLVKWQCKTCAAEAFTAGRKPPQDCKRSLRGSPL